MSAPLQKPNPAISELETTLALLNAASPRMGLEQRVLSRLASAPPPLAWYRQLAAPRWKFAAASVVIVAGTVTYSIVRVHSVASLPATPGMARPARPLHPEPASAAAGVGVPNHPLQQSAERQPPAAMRHRGIRRAYRAQHPRTVLPPGVVAPSHPTLLSGPQ
jgi:hypothetical protein